MEIEKIQEDPIVTVTEKGRIVHESELSNWIETPVTWDSSKFHRYPCYECGTKEVTTRICNNEKLKQAHYLCFTCSSENSKYQDFRILSIPFRFAAPPVLSSADIQIEK